MQNEPAVSQQIQNLTERLAEAEDTLRAVRSGEIDAFIVQGPQGDQIYALRSAEQPYRHLIEDMLEGAAILTTEGDIAYCNKRFAELIAVPLEEVMGGTMERFINGPDRAAFRSLLAAGSGKCRSQLKTAAGRILDVLLSFTTSVSDEVERRNLIITDLSELLDAQSGRDRAEQQSQAKDEFMAMLAHELRNPLSAIIAAVQVLEAANDLEGPAERARLIIGRQGHHLSRLVDDLLDVNRVVTGKIVLDRRAIDLCDLVRRAVAAFSERESRHSFEISSTPVWIEGDAVRIEQIVSNIIGNAVKYTPPGGKIAVSLHVEGGEAVLRIQDDGFGIAPELLPRVFDLFVQGERTLDRAQGGLGIGLTLVQRLVKLHRGTVRVDSDGPGRGSTFTVRLPRIAAVGASVPPSDKPAIGSVKRRVLIVEDNRDAREMFRMMLELDGHDVLEAEEGHAGLQLLRTSAPDIAFIDVGLPGLDGYEIAQRFRGENAGSDRGGAAMTSAADTVAFARETAAVASDAAAVVGDAAEVGRGAGALARDAEAVARDAAAAKETAPAGRGGTDANAGCHQVLLVALTGYGTPEALERSRRAGFDYHLIKPVNPEALRKLLNAAAADGCAAVAGGDAGASGGGSPASGTGAMRVAAPASRLYNRRLSWCGVEQSGSSSGS